MTIDKYDATVMTNDDPEKRGRIKIACVDLLGDEETEVPQWVTPNLEWGWFIVPDPGEIVQIEVLTGDGQDESFGQSSVENMQLRWSKRAWTDEEVEGGKARPINEDFKTNYGKRRGFATPNGHILLFDDTDGQQKISLTWKQGESYSYIAFDEKGNITIANKNGSMLHLDADKGATTLVEEHGNYLTMNENGLNMVDKNGNIVELKDGVIQIISQGNVVVMGNDASLETGTVHLLQSATEKIIKGDTFGNDVYDPHMHPSAFGLTGVSTHLMSIILNCLSQNGFVGD